MNNAHEIYVHHALEQRCVGFGEERGLRGTGIGHQDIDRLPRRGLRDRRFDGSLIGDIGDGREVRRARCNGIIQRPRLRPSIVTIAPACDNAAATSRPMPRPPPVTSAWEERDSFDIGGPPG